MRSRLPSLIDPYKTDRVVNCSYELSMGAEAYITGTEEKTKQTLADGQQLVVPPGQFAQLLTAEIVEVPPDSLALISMKSRLKLHGLVNVSGFHVDPGYRGRLLFSVYNAGPKDIILSQGSPAFLIWYSWLDVETDDLYEGRRAGLVEMSDEDVMRLHGDVSTPQAVAQRVDSLEQLGLSERVNKLERQIRLRDRAGELVAAVVIGILVTLGVQWIVSSLNNDEPSVPTPASEPALDPSDEPSPDSQTESGD